jgi:4-diphosphocytidyl-2-C-methyl-D-erythritol kinase
MDRDGGSAFTQFAPAKLNLYLHVTGRRGDGFHFLDSLVAFASVGDTIRVEPAAALGLTIDGPFAASLRGDPQANLVWRAADALARKLGREPRAAIRLTKNLPVASGIGGGSSDAAATLRALAELWRCDDRAALRDIAAALGSDVPACFDPGTCWLGGVGEQVEAAPVLPSCGVVLANPGIALETAAVYRAFGGPFSPPARFAMPGDAAALAGALASRRNDLMAAARQLVPPIGEVLAGLSALDAALIARMSGSGATCFALFADEAAAQAGAAKLQAENPDWWIASGRLRGKEEI